MKNAIDNKDIQLGSQIKKLMADSKSMGMPDLIERCEELESDYKFMLQFISKGIKDDMRDDLFQGMLAKAECVRRDLRHLKILLEDGQRLSLMKQMAKADVKTESLINSLRNKDLSISEHHQILEQAFITLFIHQQWYPWDERTWTAYLIDENTPSIDSYSLVSAIMLSCMDVMCPLKLKTLVSVYFATEDEGLRQRALVGSFLCMTLNKDDEYIKEQCHTLLSNEAVRSDVLQMIMQIALCNDVDKVTERINKDIMPNLLKHQRAIRLSDDSDILKSMEQSVSDALDPGKEEREMNEVERYAKQMTDMQKSGMDIFFGGFSKMKRYPFFYRLVNWFVPFYIEHPALKDIFAKIGDVSFLDHVFNEGPFCDSDKYSFAFAVAGVFTQLPENLKELMKAGTVGPIGMDPVGTHVETPVLIRRKYLQDLYRFVTLNPLINVQNVFDMNNILSFCAECELLRPIYKDLATFLVRRGLKKEASTIVSEMTENTVERYLLEGACYMDTSRSKGARAYREALSLDPDNSRAMRMVAHIEYEEGNYDKASELFSRLYEKHPDKPAFLQNRIKCLTISGHAVEVVNDAFRLDYENPDDDNAKRLLAWTLLCANRLPQAKDLYNDILAGKYGEASLADKLNMAELMAVSGDEPGAIFILKELKSNGNSEEMSSEIFRTLTDDFNVLRQYFHIGIYDATLLCDASEIEL